MYKHPIADHVDKKLLEDSFLKTIVWFDFDDSIINSLQEYPDFIEIIKTDGFDISGCLVKSNDDKVKLIINLCPKSGYLKKGSQLHNDFLNDMNRFVLRFPNVFEEITADE